MDAIDNVFRRFFDIHPMGAALYDKEGVLLHMNKTMFFHHSFFQDEEFIIKSFSDSELLTQEQKHLLQRGETVCCLSPYRFSLIPLKNEENEIVNYVLFCHEYSKVKDSDSYRQYEKIKELETMNQKVAEAIPDTILLINSRLRVERVIAYATDTCITPAAINVRVDELPGFIYPGKTKKMIVKKIKDCMQSSEMLNLEFSLPGHEEDMVYFQLRLVPMQHSYVIAYVRNVSHLVKTQKELEKNKSMMELALTNSNVATFSFDFEAYETCDKINCNRCFQFYCVNNRLLEKNQFVCRALKILKHPEDNTDFFYLFDRIKNEKLPQFSVDFRIKDDSGQYRNYEAIGKAQHFNKEGVPTVVVGCMIDNQRRFEYEKSLILAKEKAEKADRLKSTFLANMSHEIRTPLNAIVGFSDLLQDEEDSDIRKMYIDIIKSNNSLLLNLINDVLDISKIEADMITFIYSDIPVASVMKEIYNTVLLKMPEGVSLIWDQGADVCIYTDKNRFMQIMINLLTNAIKHISEGYIRFGYKVCQKEIEFYVIDTGEGIPQKEQERIFTRFVQLDESTQGIGLGLAICKGLISKMGGAIHVKSTEGKGAEFSFRLPL